VVDPFQTSGILRYNLSEYSPRLRQGHLLSRDAPCAVVFSVHRQGQLKGGPLQMAEHRRVPYREGLLRLRGFFVSTNARSTSARIAACASAGSAASMAS